MRQVFKEETIKRKNIKIYHRLGALPTAPSDNVFRLRNYFYHVVGTNIGPATASGNNPEKLKYFLYLDFWKLTNLAILAYDIKFQKMLGIPRWINN